MCLTNALSGDLIVVGLSANTYYHRTIAGRSKSVSDKLAFVRHCPPVTLPMRRGPWGKEIAMEESVRQEWTKCADPVQLQLEGMSTPLYLVPKVFKTGSVGWYLSQKAVLSDSPCQLSVCITVIGSKRTPSPEVVNGKSPYRDGFDVAPLLDAAFEVDQKASEGSRKRPKRS